MKCEVKGNHPSGLSGIRAVSITKYVDDSAVTYGDGVRDLTSSSSTGIMSDYKNYLFNRLGTGNVASSKAQMTVTFFKEDGEPHDATWAINKSDDLVGSYPIPAVGRSKIKYGTYYYFPNIDKTITSRVKVTEILRGVKNLNSN